MPATAANVPTDLFGLILSFYVPDAEDKFKGLHRVYIHKRKLAAIALVCRHWARACQPKLFRDIILRNLQDAETLLELVNNPTSRVVGYLETVTFGLADDHCRIPWIYHACRKLKHNSRLPSSVVFRIVAEDIQSKQFATAVSNRGLRCNRIVCIDRLQLQGTRFVQLEDLGRVIRELSCLKDADFRGVQWEEPRDRGELPALVPWLLPACSPSTRFHMGECTDNAATLWLECLRAPGKTSQVQAEELQTLCRIVHLAGYHGYEPLCAWREKDQIYVQSPSLSRRWALHAVLMSTSTSQKQVRQLKFNIEDAAFGADAENEWLEADRQIGYLPHLDEVEIHIRSFRHTSEHAARTVALTMPRLCCSGKLRFFLDFEKGGESHTVSRTVTVRFDVENWLEETTKSLGWTPEKAAALLEAFRQQNLGAYEPLITELREAARAEEVRRLMDPE
ncbi:hypothetical protein NM688_g9241 [Phlebia brevispora]|uniref:Uncharacterized protein n=1 Tax=Phlebia brevispora TaxID=194682 RepID=A0ACC1RKF8_9APHY|nr:hypothetical protein NM688_g9241 [Phlebia brevispora]